MYDVNAGKPQVIILYTERCGSSDNPALDLIDYSVYVNYNFRSLHADFVSKDNSTSETLFWGNVIPIWQERCDVTLIKL